MEAPTITAGAVVRLKSGGPKMTVMSDADKTATCIWLAENANEMSRDTFPVTCLTIVATKSLSDFGVDDTMAKTTCSAAVATAPAILLDPHEIQSGHTRVDWAEGLIRQLPEDHDGRNSWLLNYGKVDAKPSKLSAHPTAALHRYWDALYVTGRDAIYVDFMDITRADVDAELTNRCDTFGAPRHLTMTFKDKLHQTAPDRDMALSVEADGRTVNFPLPATAGADVTLQVKLTDEMLGVMGQPVPAPKPTDTVTSFADFVQAGRDSGAPVGSGANGRPWSFTWHGYAVSHENDECYLISVPGVPSMGVAGTTLRFTPRDMLVTNHDGKSHEQIEVLAGTAIHSQLAGFTIQQLRDHWAVMVARNLVSITEMLNGVRMVLSNTAVHDELVARGDRPMPF